MDMQFASLWESTADQLGDHPALVCGDVVTSWKDYDDRAARLAMLLTEKGLGDDSKVGIYLHNCNEYLEAQYSIFKIKGVPINVNYRYKADELTYLLDNCDAEAVFYQACYSDQIDLIKSNLPKVKVFIQLDDNTNPLLSGSVDYDEGIAGYEPKERIRRSGDNIYMLYTGGTTGMPKGVMYQHGPFINSMCKTLKGMGFDMPEDPKDIGKTIDSLKEAKALPVSLVACPLMHGTGMWLGSYLPLIMGGSVVTTSNLGLDSNLLWKEVERNKATNMTIVGDAFARPLLDELESAKNKGQPYNISSLQLMISSGVMWSSEVKDGLLSHHDMVLMDAFGSTEGGMGSSMSSRDSKPKTAKFSINPGVIIINDKGESVEPGSGERGKLGLSAMVPLGYYKDPIKSAETFKEHNGVRYSFPGDYATVELDGTINLLGRGSNCINTAGEKVYPEEVEEAIKLHPNIYDCLVVGLEDKRFGQKVVALASFSGEQEISEQDLIIHTREHLAGYKLPKDIIFVTEVERAPNGKANYKWAKEEAESTLS
jgi:3-oxocholest-4-en-26-oate---CoA ligase